MKLDELDSQLEKNQLSGFWRTRVPGHASEAPYLWKWEPLLDGLLKASETIGIEQAERRAIRLVSPHLPIKSTSHTLQYLFDRQSGRSGEGASPQYGGDSFRRSGQGCLHGGRTARSFLWKRAT